MLSELVDGAGLQQDLFDSASTDNSASGKSERLMAIIDEINLKSRAALYMARAAGPAAHAMSDPRIPPLPQKTGMLVSTVGCQQVLYGVVLLCREAGEHIFEVGIGIMLFSFADWTRVITADAR